ncbi:MAG: 1,2-phenylacetyl-CoA epoxidase subunit PaaD [Bacteroidota bacterium]
MNIETSTYNQPGAGIENIWKILEAVSDPEIPVLSILDLGIVRNVTIKGDFFAKDDGYDVVTITITPTYSGCPAMDMITVNIRMALLEHGYKNIQIKTVLSPAWTTDWMTESGKVKLAAYGIAPPAFKIAACNSMESDDQMAIQCPHCKSYRTEMISRFGSTACKALFKCHDCSEPFDYFKCH